MKCSCNNTIAINNISKHLNDNKCEVKEEMFEVIQSGRINVCKCGKWFPKTSYYRHLAKCESKMSYESLQKEYTKLLDEKTKLTEEFNNLKKKYDEIYLAYSKLKSSAENFHKENWGEICTKEVKLEFNSYVADFSPKKKKLYEKEWENFFKNSNIYEKKSIKEYFSRLLTEKGLTLSTVAKKHRILKNILLNCYNLDIPKIETEGIDYVKGKYSWKLNEIFEFLEFLKKRSEFNFTKKEYVLFCSMLFCYGMRPIELYRLTGKGISSFDKNLDLLDKKAKKLKRIKLYESHYNILIDLKKKPEDSFFTHLGSWQTVKNQIRRYMVMYFGPGLCRKIKENNKSIGVYCCRKTCLNESFSKTFKVAQEAVSNISNHVDKQSLLHYVETEYQLPVALNFLDNYRMLGKKRNRVLFKKTEENFKLSRKYLQSIGSEKEKLCSFCKLLIFDNYFKCNICDDHFHMNCNLSKGDMCLRCNYLMNDFRVYLNINNTSCLYCNKPEENFICNGCLNNMTIKSGNNKIIVEKTGIKEYARSTQIQKEWHDLTLQTALNAQNLKLTIENVCCEKKCSCLDISNALYCSKMTQNTSKIYTSMKKNTPPLAVANSEKLGGYFVFATNDIPANTMITEYLGDVYNANETVFDQNDSHMYIINGGCSDNSKIIIPKKHANIAKFISGAKIDKEANVKSQSMYYENKNHIILYSIKLIKKGDILFYEYNGNYNVTNFLNHKNIGHVDENTIQKILNNEFILDIK